MSDEPFYSPTWKAAAARRKPIPTELQWELRKDHVTWSCELRFHGESYRECRTLRDGELHMSQRFVLKEHAIQWAESERADREKGGA